MKIARKVIVIGIFVWIVYCFWIWIAWFLIDNGYTSAKSEEIIIEANIVDDIPASNRQAHKYISENPKDAYKVLEAYTYLNGTGSNNEQRFPKNNWWLDFVIKGISARKAFINTVTNLSKQLNIDPDLVMACVLWEQIRIANKWARGNLKNIITWMTPRLLRSYNVSLWIGWIKIETAKRIKKDAIEYWYKRWPFDNMWKLRLWDDIITSSWLADNDAFNAKYSTFLVKNIITRRKNAWYDISHNPWIVWTLYNMGNDKDKIPHNNPKIWGSIINIWNNKYVYWGISMVVYWYLKIYK